MYTAESGVFLSLEWFENVFQKVSSDADASVFYSKLIYGILIGQRFRFWDSQLYFAAFFCVSDGIVDQI